MTITLDQVRAELSLDDYSYNNVKLTRLIASAKASLIPTVGDSATITNKPESIAQAFDELSNTYIVEYCRALLFGVDNEKLKLSLQVQMQSLLQGQGATEEDT